MPTRLTSVVSAPEFTAAFSRFSALIWVEAETKRQESIMTDSLLPTTAPPTPELVPSSPKPRTNEQEVDLGPTGPKSPYPEENGPEAEVEEQPS